MALSHVRKNSMTRTSASIVHEDALAFNVDGFQAMETDILNKFRAVKEQDVMKVDSTGPVESKIREWDAEDDKEEYNAVINEANVSNKRRKRDKSTTRMHKKLGDQKRSPRWYFGGLSSAAAVNITHPFDLIKVHLQTQQLPRKSLWQTVLHIYENGGLLGFYQGISASIARQLTATMARFGIYETGKCHIDSSKISHSIALAMSAGFVGGLVGVPNDVVNVRMQNDMKLPPDQQRNYKHVFDGLFRIVQEEGAGKLLTGAPVAIGRGMLLTISQNVVYDTSKSYLLRELQFDDNIGVHFTCSLTSGGCATLATQPLDVVKTRLMNAKAGKYDSYLSVITHIGRTGPVGFFKGFIPAFARIGPHTVLTFLIMEQLRLHFGHPPVNSN